MVIFRSYGTDESFSIPVEGGLLMKILFGQRVPFTFKKMALKKRFVNLKSLLLGFSALKEAILDKGFTMIQVTVKSVFQSHVYFWCSKFDKNFHNTVPLHI